MLNKDLMQVMLNRYQVGGLFPMNDCRSPRIPLLGALLSNLCQGAALDPSGALVVPWTHGLGLPPQLCNDG